MLRRVRAIGGFLALAVLVAACGLPLPQPIELEGGLLGLDGLPVQLTAVVGPAGTVSTAASTTFRGTIPETTFTVEAADVPAILRSLVRIRSATEDLSLDVDLRAESLGALPASFAVTGLTVSDIVLRKGAKLVWSGAFGATGASMTFTQGACDLDGCAYAATLQPALADVAIAGGAADAVAKEFIAGGTFTLSAVVTVTVSEPLPDDTIIDATLVSLGAVLE